MNHLYHTLSPLLLLTSIALLLLSILSPTMTLHEHVSLLTVKTSSSATSVNVSSLDGLRKRSTPSHVELSLAHSSKRMIRRRASSKITSLVANTSASTSGETVTLYFGPLGACTRFTSSPDATCDPSSLTPLFSTLYESLGLLPTLTFNLPEQFPLTPTALLLSFVLLTLACAVSLTAASGHHVKRLEKFQERGVKLRKVVMASLGLGWTVGVAATLAFFFKLRSEASAIGDGATLGLGFHLLLAVWVLSLLSLILLFCENYTSRAK